MPGVGGSRNCKQQLSHFGHGRQEHLPRAPHLGHGRGGSHGGPPSPSHRGPTLCLGQRVLRRSIKLCGMLLLIQRTKDMIRASAAAALYVLSILPWRNLCYSSLLSLITQIK
ncbi:hypothetical protein PVAP13_3NG304512 [Panicum virgatum]|uniref:Uncharacterized protein n=1 Tax=Panicum virgatum TaxID=38727 RepID=A0A8T0UMP7_PANVG|nr:hypothetical protein PVAP13_3NG304512 [Panicum virgatum]